MTLARWYPRLRPKARRERRETSSLAIDCATQSTRWFFRAIQNMRNERSFGGYLIFANISEALLIFLQRAHRSFVPARFTKKEKKKRKTRQMENRTRRVPEDFAFIARKYFFAGDGRRTHTRRAVYSVDDPLRARSYSDGTKIGLDWSTLLFSPVNRILQLEFKSR